MSRNLTPLPARTGRAGTFDGMEKLFFERAAAIEAGEMTAPPEVIGVPHTWWRRWLGQLMALQLYQKVGIGAGVLFMLAAAVLALRGGPAPKAAPQPDPVQTQAVVAPPADPKPATVKKQRSQVGPAGTARRASSRHARTKHARTTKTTSSTKATAPIRR